MSARGRESDHGFRDGLARALAKALSAREDALEAPVWLSLQMGAERQAALDAYPLPSLTTSEGEIVLQVVFDLAVDFARRSGVTDDAAVPLVAALIVERLERIALP